MLITPKQLAAKQATANALLPKVVQEVLPRGTPIHSSHRQDIAAVAEIENPGLSLRVLAAVEANDTEAALELVRAAVDKLLNDQAELFAFTPTYDEVLAVFCEWLGRRPDAELEAMADRLKNSDQGRREVTVLRAKLRQRSATRGRAAAAGPVGQPE